jgi:hypothetical protein
VAKQIPFTAPVPLYANNQKHHHDCANAEHAAQRVWCTGTIASLQNPSLAVFPQIIAVQQRCVRACACTSVRACLCVRVCACAHKHTRTARASVRRAGGGAASAGPVRRQRRRAAPQRRQRQRLRACQRPGCRGSQRAADHHDRQCAAASPSASPACAVIADQLGTRVLQSASMAALRVLCAHNCSGLVWPARLMPPIDEY